MTVQWLLEAVDISRTFGGVRANQGITLRVAPGEIRGLIGPNGAGKTTLTNVLSGIYPPQSGDVRLGGESLIGLTPMQISRKGMLRTFQTPKLFGTMTVEENLLLPSLARRPLLSRAVALRAQQRADELLELTRLGRIRRLAARSLSGGEQALLQVATGFMVEDLRCYLLDEPFAGINPVLKERVIELIQYENRTRGITFLVISHEMATVRQLCARVSVLAEGRLLTEGTMDEVASDPAVITAYLGKGGAA
jgi:branched-chain amino acid transport system ATP-binding protein